MHVAFARAVELQTDHFFLAVVSRGQHAKSAAKLGIEGRIQESYALDLPKGYRSQAVDAKEIELMCFLACALRLRFHAHDLAGRGGPGSTALQDQFNLLAAGLVEDLAEG